MKKIIIILGLLTILIVPFCKNISVKKNNSEEIISKNTYLEDDRAYEKILRIGCQQGQLSTLKHINEINCKMEYFRQSRVDSLNERYIEKFDITMTSK